MSSLWRKSREHSLLYQRSKVRFCRYLKTAPLDPLRDATPFCNLRDLRDFPILLRDFVSVLEAERHDERVVKKMKKLIEFFPYWEAQQSRRTLRNFSIRNEEDIRTLIRNIMVARVADQEEQYLEFQHEWRFLNGVFLAMTLKSDWHPHNIWQSAIYHSSHFKGTGSSREREMLLKCYLLPSILRHEAAQQLPRVKSKIMSRDYGDLRTFFKLDTSYFGGREARPLCRCNDNGISLCPVPSCSQLVSRRVRHGQKCKDFERQKQTKHQMRRLTQYFRKME